MNPAGRLRARDNIWLNSLGASTWKGPGECHAGALASPKAATGPLGRLMTGHPLRTAHTAYVGSPCLAPWDQVDRTSPRRF